MLVKQGNHIGIWRRAHIDLSSALITMSVLSFVLLMCLKTKGGGKSFPFQGASTFIIYLHLKKQNQGKTLGYWICYRKNTMCIFEILAYLLGLACSLYTVPISTVDVSDHPHLRWPCSTSVSPQSTKPCLLMTCILPPPGPKLDS